jgi:hypothetical protein
VSLIWDGRWLMARWHDGARAAVGCCSTGPMPLRRPTGMPCASRWCSGPRRALGFSCGGRMTPQADADAILVERVKQGDVRASRCWWSSTSAASSA